MSNKRERIKMLKQTVATMQIQLRIMEKNSKKQVDRPEFLKPINKITNIKRKRKFSHTQRDLSLTLKDTHPYFAKDQSKGQKEREGIRVNTEKSLSPVLREITSKVENSYYLFKSSTHQKQSYNETENINKKTSKNYFTKNSQSPQKYYFSTTMPIERKLRTFQMPRTDTVLNPEKEKQKGIKMVRMMERSPDKILTDHPLANQKAFIINEKQVIWQQKKPCEERNRSHLINSQTKGEMMPSRQASQQKGIRSQKKHFERYQNQYFSKGGSFLEKLTIR